MKKKTKLAKKRVDEITLKMNRVIKTSSKNQKVVVARYLSLANRELNGLIKVLETHHVFGMVGSGLALRQNFESKFGAFGPETKVIIRRD